MKRGEIYYIESTYRETGSDLYRNLYNELLSKTMKGASA